MFCYFSGDQRLRNKPMLEWRTMCTGQLWNWTKLPMSSTILWKQLWGMQFLHELSLPCFIFLSDQILQWIWNFVQHYVCNGIFPFTDEFLFDRKHLPKWWCLFTGYIDQWIQLQLQTRIHTISTLPGKIKNHFLFTEIQPTMFWGVPRMTSSEASYSWIYSRNENINLARQRRTFQHYKQSIIPNNSSFFTN